MGIRRLICSFQGIYMADLCRDCVIGRQMDMMVGFMDFIWLERQLSASLPVVVHGVDSRSATGRRLKLGLLR